MRLWQFLAVLFLEWVRVAFNPADALRFPVKRDANYRRARHITAIGAPCRPMTASTR
jgi:hypothetical protein